LNPTIDLSENRYSFLLTSQQEKPVFGRYLDQVANKGLLPYKAVFQYGGKRGESLFTHVLNGVTVLESLRPPLQLSDRETELLFTAFTVHDLNKAPAYQGTKQSFGTLASQENIAAEIERHNLAEFFPGWRDYLAEIESLIRGHSGHYHHSGETLFADRGAAYRLPEHRVAGLIKLMRAADIIDLSHTLAEQDKKQTFLSHLNVALADFGLDWQYEFFTHQLTEQRGLLTNLIHNAVRSHLRQTYQLIPLLYYPDGVAYLKKRGQPLVVSQSDYDAIGKKVAAAVSSVTGAEFEEFINSTAHGIKVNKKCLQLGISFEKILNEISNLVHRRNLDAATLEEKVREKAEREFDRSEKAYPQAAEAVQTALDGDGRLVPTEDARLRVAELLRSYYVFLNKHFKKRVSDPWKYIYDLLELPAEHHPFYEYFNALYSRAYVLAADVAEPYEAVFERLLVDGTILTEETQGQDPKISLFSQYVSLYLVLGQAQPARLKSNTHLAHYVTHQHKQCVHCSGPFPTNKWMTADVRSDITVQTFSNRLRGGPGEPKKNICAVCQTQFMLEKLNYPEVRGEKTLYLHLYPYSFLTGPFIESLQNSIAQVTQTDASLKALNLDLNASLGQNPAVESFVPQPQYRLRTKKDKPQPYGLYLTRYSETLGNLLIFPLNPSGGNDTEQFLFALWNGLVLQRHLGLKVLLSAAPVAPLEADHLPDLYIDNIPLTCQGLLPRNDYAQYKNGTGQDEAETGPLVDLWKRVLALHQLSRVTFVSDDTTPRLVRALLGHPLNIFYEAEKLFEARVRNQESGGLLTHFMRENLPHVQTLVDSKGDHSMTQLSQELQKLAQAAWQNRIKGRTLEKNALLFPVNEIFQKIRMVDEMVDLDTLKAATAQDIFDHIDRISDEQYKPGRTKLEAIKQYVDGWFETVLGQIYGGNTRRFVSDEKLIRSAYHFYIRAQISSKGAAGDGGGDEAE